MTIGVSLFGVPGDNQDGYVSPPSAFTARTAKTCETPFVRPEIVNETVEVGVAVDQTLELIEIQPLLVTGLSTVPVT